MPEAQGRNPLERFMNSVESLIEGPVVWFRETVVEPNRKNYPWYHQQFRRVPSIDQCYTDDEVCFFEANNQFKRDRMVDNEILNILRLRFEDCVMYEQPDHERKCRPLLEQYEKGAENWFIKYGDLGGYANAKTCYMKQKHRMIWERRHGPVGSGMKQTDDIPAEH
ncbi:NADH dehydrogenase [ubiquinone] 1 beta subcomplex subunit 10 [Sabethes cyaneus]|uniref:NADH dehydrogenase [ubiquinone] 1 beta subcomplex subunit 10 n=1 Tax=Sabethes cyaneus TaxID=53552 RepID=UPI00221E2A82|nr:NADH dehydrogenase [ubiquinone] 1 beta subcomplex subunit 10 [Sabethes cyaneus]